MKRLSNTQEMSIYSATTSTVKLYYVEIEGRINSLLKLIAGKRCHCEVVSAKNRKFAEEIAWDNFIADMNDLYESLVTRRDFKITSEDVTGVYEEGEVYYTLEELKY